MKKYAVSKKCSLTLREVESVCRQAQRSLKRDGRLKLQNAYKSGLTVLGLSVPCIKSLVRKGFSFDGASELEKFTIWTDIWRGSPCHEVKTLALMFFASLDTDALISRWRSFKTIAGSVENWAHSDSYSGIFARIFEASPSLVEPQILIWNGSHNLWERRISLTGLYYYSALRKKQPNHRFVLRCLRSLLDDEEYYVQKAMGWTLRELGNAEPKVHKIFLEGNLGAIDSRAFSAAIEKLPTKFKENLKRKRRYLRAKYLK